MEPSVPVWSWQRGVIMTRRIGGRLVARALTAVVLCMGVSVAQAEEAPISAEFRTDIERLLDASGAVSIARQMVQVVSTQMIAVVKQRRPDIPERSLEVVPEAIGEVVDENRGSLTELLVGLYAKYFTDDEVKQLTQFYLSNAGRKLVQVTPMLVVDSVMIGQQWGQSIAPQIEKRVTDKLKAKGYSL